MEEAEKYQQKLDDIKTRIEKLQSDINNFDYSIESAAAISEDGLEVLSLIRSITSSEEEFKSILDDALSPFIEDDEERGVVVEILNIVSHPDNDNVEFPV